ncbi:MAG TPA: VCBS repeat-containing protein, partial [Pyrinomonadaceae bacterium]
GKPDLIVANLDDDLISVLLNTTAAPTAAISFAAQQTSATGTNPVASIAADINRDGLPDLVVANHGDNTVSVLVNKTVPGATMPSFAAQQMFTLESSPSSIIATDINADGKIDLIAAHPTSGNVAVLLNTTAARAAAPSFAYEQSFTAGSGAASVVAADVNSDGKVDLIVANSNEDDVSILLNATAPGSAAPSFSSSTFAAGSKPCAVTIVDVNGDGKPDPIVTNSSDGIVSVLLNGTAPGAVTPTFAGPTTFGVGANPCGIAAADINGDGLPDLIVANEGDNTVSVLVNTTVPGAPTPSFALQQAFATALNPSSVIAVDANGDGKLDLIVSNADDFSVSVLVNKTPSGSTTASFAVRRDFATGLSPLTVAATDLNGDGKLDLFVANSLDDTVSVLFDTQLRAMIGGGQATGTIIHDYILANGFE